MTFKPALKQLAFVLPNSFKSAELTFQKRFGKEQEVRIVLQKEPYPRQVVSTHQLSKGLWHVILEWCDDNYHYWTEQDILVN